ncbi:MAG TPA: aldo/keto reductase family protein [Chthonomonadaceae bacterium]|nr:aldo/keto reductase family protein [Chthonomonadaceae bacterium]
MQYRRLGASGLKVSEVCLGSWLTFGNATEDQTAIDCIDKAYELGMNFFDTANVYARGASETVVGKALRKYDRETYVVATKVYFPMSDGPMPNNSGLSRKHIMEQCEASLRRLGLDYIDLYQCHRYDPETPLEETLRALDDLVRQGKVLYVGFSQWTASQIEDAVAFQVAHNLNRFVSSQPYYNLLGRDAEKAVIPVCEREGIGQIVYSPLAQGLLTGKYKPGQPPPADSRAADPKQNMFLNGGKLDDARLEKIQKLVPIAQEAGLSMAQLALAWCLRKRNISSVIIGASRPSQVEDNAGASGVTLSPEVLKAIDEAVA